MRLTIYIVYTRDWIDTQNKGHGFKVAHIGRAKIHAETLIKSYKAHQISSMSLWELKEVEITI